MNPAGVLSAFVRCSVRVQVSIIALFSDSQTGNPVSSNTVTAQQGAIRSTTPVIGGSVSGGVIIRGVTTESGEIGNVTIIALFSAISDTITAAGMVAVCSAGIGGGVGIGSSVITLFSVQWIGGRVSAGGESAVDSASVGARVRVSVGSFDVGTSEEFGTVIALFSGIGSSKVVVNKRVTTSPCTRSGASCTSHWTIVALFVGIGDRVSASGVEAVWTASIGFIAVLSTVVTLLLIVTNAKVIGDSISTSEGA